jgi:tetratricopeptide (TPR) repeat protein
MTDPNLIPQITPLARILRQEGFRFIVISQNHGDIARDTAVFLKEKLQNRPIITISLHGKAYNAISAEIVAAGNAHTSPIVIIPDFGLLFAPENTEINTAFNQRRDYYGSLNIAFVCFFFTDAAQLVRKRLPDWWSVRSYVLDATITLPKTTENPRSLTPDAPIIDKTKIQQNNEEIERLLYQINLANPDNIPLLSNLYLQLGDLYQENYELAAALDAYNRVLEMNEGRNEEVLVAKVYNNIGVLYGKKGDYDTALDYHKKSLDIKEKVLGTEHPDTATAYNNIAGIYKSKGDYDTALDYYKKSLDIKEKVLGTEHPSTATAYNNIGQIYSSKGDYDTALYYYKKAVAIWEKVLGTEHPDTATAYNNIGQIYESKGDYDTALDYYKKSLDIRETVLGTEHPSTATSYNNIAGAYKSKGDYDTALNYYKKAVIILKKVLTLQHPNTKIVFNNYKNALIQGKESLPPTTFAAHVAFIHAEFSDYLA